MRNKIQKVFGVKRTHKSKVSTLDGKFDSFCCKFIKLCALNMASALKQRIINQKKNSVKPSTSLINNIFLVLDVSLTHCAHHRSFILSREKVYLPLKLHATKEILFLTQYFFNNHKTAMSSATAFPYALRARYGLLIFFEKKNNSFSIEYGYFKWVRNVFCIILNRT